MGIFKTHTNVAERHPEVNEAQHSIPLQTAVEMFGNCGGLSSLHTSAESHGLGHIVGSWLGNGPNQSISSDQVQTLVGQDRVNQLASRAGLSSGLASAAFSPSFARLTPQGKLPQAA